MRVLYFSMMTVSPGSGGGNTVFNLLEPSQPDSEVFYATPTSHAPHWAPFAELGARICWFDLPSPVQLRGGSKISAIRKVNGLWARLRANSLRRSVVTQLIEHIRKAEIEVLLLCPQSMLDLTASVDVLQKTGLPAVVWFMDNYYSNRSAAAVVKQLWDRSHRRFVVSEGMEQYFSKLYGGECRVLNNSVSIPCYSAPTVDPKSRLRIVYAGAMNGYYLDSILMVLNELSGLDPQIELDIYSHERLLDEYTTAGHFPYRQRPPVPASKLVERLRQYDVLLLLSSFKLDNRPIAETSLASKIADYLVTGRCILAFGPGYAENVRYARRYGFAEVVTSREDLRAAVLALARDPERRRKIGERAYYFGRKRHNQEANTAKLWRALSDACASSNEQQRICHGKRRE
jgi:glycosyltransferase involved in cell wall biosynthesis